MRFYRGLFIILLFPELSPPITKKYFQIKPSCVVEDDDKLTHIIEAEQFSFKGHASFCPGGGGRSEAWDRETMFSQLAKRSSQNVDSGVRHNKYFRSTINVFEIVCKICLFCRGKVSGERLISHGTYCQFRTREYSMEATSMKTLLFSHCLVCCSGEWISCELYGSHVSLVYTWRPGLRETFQS